MVDDNHGFKWCIAGPNRGPDNSSPVIDGAPVFRLFLHHSQQGGVTNSHRCRELQNSMTATKQWFRLPMLGARADKRVALCGFQLATLKPRKKKQSLEETKRLGQLRVSTHLGMCVGVIVPTVIPIAVLLRLRPGR